MSTSDTDIFDYNKFVLHQTKFSVLLLLQIPAFALSLLIFTFFMKNRTIIRAPHNQALLILLIVNFIQLTFTLPLDIHFYYLGYVSPATPIFCTWWTFFEYTLYVISEYLMATISVQRHMLVFNAHVLRICWMRIVLHKLPLILCLIYPVVFYFFSIIIYPCDGTQWDYTSNLCGFADCYLLSNKVLGTFDWSMNNGLPMLINALANIMLIVRVIKQKHSQHRPVTWKKQRRMTVQLFCISSLYLAAWSPCLIVGFVQILAFPTFLSQIQSDYFLDLIYVVCLGLQPELLRWINKIYYCKQPRNVVGTMQQTQLLTKLHAAETLINT
jgi:hypothetical protein